jgi:hypothetical protein
VPRALGVRHRSFTNIPSSLNTLERAVDARTGGHRHIDFQRGALPILPLLLEGVTSLVTVHF